MSYKLLKITDPYVVREYGDVVAIIYINTDNLFYYYKVRPLDRRFNDDWVWLAYDMGHELNVTVTEGDFEAVKLLYGS